jgi:hypothetical protein
VAGALHSDVCMDSLASLMPTVRARFASKNCGLRRIRINNEEFNQGSGLSMRCRAFFAS